MIPLNKLFNNSLDTETEKSYFDLLTLNSHLLAPYVNQILFGTQAAIDPETSTTFAMQGSNVDAFEEPGELVYSVIESEKVMGFNVWGEVRLCLPHLLRFVLNDVDIDIIGQAISKLKIACSKCSLCQLSLLHACNALPCEVTSCGLIRKSDAERMLKFLRSSRKRPTLAEIYLTQTRRSDILTDSVCKSDKEVSTKIKDSGVGGTVLKEDKITDFLSDYIDVRHDCFGRQHGQIYPKLYITSQSPCILCQACDRLFSPQDFVGHTHRITELDSCCHWGFDSTNWRSYIHLDIPLISGRKKSTKNNSLNPSTLDPKELEVNSYKMLKDFKIKFLKPLNIPEEIAERLGELDPKQPQSIKIIDNSSIDNRSSVETTTSSNLRPTNDEQNDLIKINRKENVSDSQKSTKLLVRSQCKLSSPLEMRLKSNIAIRRLWAPHEGKLFIPEPPKLITDCPKGPKPKHFSTNAPELLDPSCVVLNNSAHLYDRDFTPNVCLKPVLAPQFSKSLSSVPSNDDISIEKRPTPSFENMSGKSSLCFAREISQRFGSSMGCSINGSSPVIYSMNASPARSRHFSCDQEHVTPMSYSFTRPSVSSTDIRKTTLTDRTKRTNSDRFSCDFNPPSILDRCLDFPSIDGHEIPNLKRTSSNPELNSCTSLNSLHFALKRPYIERSSKIQPTSTEKSIYQNQTGAFLTRSKRSYIPNSNGETPHFQSNNKSNSSAFEDASKLEPSVNYRSSKMGEEIRSQNAVPDWISVSNIGIPNLIAHWRTLVEHIAHFSNVVDPSNLFGIENLNSADRDKNRCTFELERARLFAELNSIQGVQLANLSALLEENRRLKKLLTDTQFGSKSAHSLTPNVLAPPFTEIPTISDNFKSNIQSYPSLSMKSANLLMLRNDTTLEEMLGFDNNLNHMPKSTNICSERSALPCDRQLQDPNSSSYLNINGNTNILDLQKKSKAYTPVTLSDPDCTEKQQVTQFSCKPVEAVENTHIVGQFTNYSTGISNKRKRFLYRNSKFSVV